MQACIKERFAVRCHPPSHLPTPTLPRAAPLTRGQLRGINVGGKNRLPMKRLVAILEELGCCHVKTYIQSGNAVFRSTLRDTAAFAETLGRQIESHEGFRPRVMLKSLEELERAIAANPFPHADDDPKSLHVFFLADSVDQDHRHELESLRAESERFEFIGQALYLYAPDGMGRSKLAANAERMIGVPMTARNMASDGDTTLSRGRTSDSTNYVCRRER